MAIQSKHLVLLALIVLPACVSSGTQSPSPIHALEMAGSSRETAIAATISWGMIRVVAISLAVVLAILVFRKKKTTR